MTRKTQTPHTRRPIVRPSAVMRVQNSADSGIKRVSW